MKIKDSFYLSFRKPIQHVKKGELWRSWIGYNKYAWVWEGTKPVQWRYQIFFDLWFFTCKFKFTSRKHTSK